MQIVEVKNNLVKINYDTAVEKLILSGFVVIKDESFSFIGQIVHLEANGEGNFAVIKLLFTFDDTGNIFNYNGAVPATNAMLDIVQPQELLGLLPLQSPFIIGELAQQDTLLKLDGSLLEDKLLVCCEKEEENYILTKNLVKQLISKGKKVLILDLGGISDFLLDSESSSYICAGKDFKLPLNYDTINFIYQNGLEDATAESKALIQEIFLEVQNYVNTLPEKFLPFEVFKKVVDEQYEELNIVELVLLKNKLLKYYEEGIFAQNEEDFNILKNIIENEKLIVFDLSKIEESVQKEMISYLYSLIMNINEKIYVICNIEDENSDKKLLKKIFTSQNAYSTIVCSYSYKYLKELKQLSKNLILFAPIHQQNDFAGYNTFLDKLNPKEFIIYGQATHNLPLIVKLEDLTNPDIDNSTDKQNVQIQEQFQDIEQELIDEENLLDEEIRRDVDSIYMTQKVEDLQQEHQEYTLEHEQNNLTEDDLDFIDNLNLSQDESIEEIFEQESFEQVQEEIFESKTTQEETFSETLVLQNDEIENIASEDEILPVEIASAPTLPVYSAKVEPIAQSDELVQGDIVTHSKYGKGSVEKLITYGSKTLCSINFDNVGRRLLDPTLAEIKKI
jgi:hypothetical protein